jgi:5-methylcytosine-specific restriction endonuclease McrA
MLGIDLERADGGFSSDLHLIAGNTSRALSQLVLRTDVSGMPLEWIDYKEAARLYHQEQVAYTCGSPLFKLYGGVSARSGLRTILEVNSIVATVGHTGNRATRVTIVPPLNNQILFRRDAHFCMYCARFPVRELSRDHIRPFSQGGRDAWTNVVAACRRCNNPKASRTPEQARCSSSRCRSPRPTRNTSS